MAYISVHAGTGSSRLVLVVLVLLSAGCGFASQAVAQERSLADTGSFGRTTDVDMGHVAKRNAIRPEAGVCQTARHAGVCTCSLPTIETELSFGEAAGIIELYFYNFPDESYVELLSSLLRQCSGTLSSTTTSPPVAIRQGNQSAASAQ
jgi:hypothetical protein